MAITCKLLQHDKNFSADDVIIFKDYPGLSLGDIVEVYHEDGDYSRLLLKVKQINNEGTGQQKGSLNLIINFYTYFDIVYKLRNLNLISYFGKFVAFFLI